ncbi:hypothetical protein [Polyangium sp. 15x6]|uniref:hypothetical protein n=1 Tax=Polyangium sp. 15x6 TaxID=3042687 RepID=UPI00249AB050|nr:hypothetical protein [Polyangium sp. 15x6]MDI3282278.1 hypothetical protein [Polyangium sp. 15x6]
MKHTLDELLDIVYRYYPRGVGMVDGDLDRNAIDNSEEHARLVAARKKAATDERWHALRRRIEERFPEAPLMNYSLHLPTGGHDACYSFAIHLPGASRDRSLWFQVSFLAPYYIIHKSCTIDIVKETRKDFFPVIFQGLHFQVDGSPFDPRLVSNPDDERLKHVTIERHYITFDLLPDERPYAEWIAREIEATFGCEPMPPEVGTLLVPDLATPHLPGENRLYDCLFSDQHTWVKPSPSDVPAPGVRVDPSQLTEPFKAVLTVQAALFGTLLTLERETKSFYAVVGTDGTLRKEEMLRILAEIRKHLDLPATPRVIAAKGELEASMRAFETLLAAWEGDGAPSDAMVAWASNFLARWDVDENEAPRDA